ncbi:MAG: FtsX-like permease family protein [Candidatus Aminicenantes bacterium]|nr:FtsX-like permease family protein [Candidatus Aminicenantes bacterium]
MFRNYLKIAVRNIGRRKGYSFINVSGLALGMAICILIMLWVYDESQLRTNVPGAGDITNIYLFSAIAFIILLMACINFMNLTTARGADRLKEVGIRKVVGARRSGIINQFLSESFLLAFFALILAAIFVELLLPAFSRLTGKQLMSTWLGNPFILPGMIVVTLVTGIMAGSYPAFFLSSFQPVKVLKSTLKPGTSGGLFRKALVIFQFSLAVIFLVGSMAIYRQLDYIKNIVDKFPDGMLTAEKRVMMIFIYLSLLAIFIACHGLYGLSVFLAEQRTREIGIRKVFGASGTDVWRLFSCQFMKWIITANLLAWPIAYILLDALLIRNSAYRIRIGPWPFVLSGILTSVIALLTVGFQTFKAASANPSDTLRRQ